MQDVDRFEGAVAPTTDLPYPTRERYDSLDVVPQNTAQLVRTGWRWARWNRQNYQPQCMQRGRHDSGRVTDLKFAY